jgi:hypothetical protein
LETHIKSLSSGIKLYNGMLDFKNDLDSRGKESLADRMADNLENNNNKIMVRIESTLDYMAKPTVSKAIDYKVDSSNAKALTPENQSSQDESYQEESPQEESSQGESPKNQSSSQGQSTQNQTQG